MKHWSLLQKKIVTLDKLIQEIPAGKNRNKKLVFTNGCFDILHKGHVQYLCQSADLGDILVVGLNSDDSVKRQGKGEDRPVNQWDARALVLAGLNCVDYVVEFTEDTPIHLIESLIPDVLVKGGDYDPSEENALSKKYIVGREVVLQNSGTVEVIDLVEGFSTTGILKKLKK